MKLSFHPERSNDRYPAGYWYASTDNGDHDADGTTPLDAVSALASTLERELNEWEHPKP